MPYQITATTKAEPSRHPTYHLSYKLMPEVWYENGIKLRLAYAVVAVLLLTLFLPRYGYRPPLYWSVIGASIHLMGLMVDITSTWLCLRMVSKFEARNLDFPLIETSPVLSNRPTLSELLFSPATVFGAFAVMVSWIFPGAGIATGWLQIGVGINNLRQRQRLQLQLSLYDEVEKSRGV